MKSTRRESQPDHIRFISADECSSSKYLFRRFVARLGTCLPPSAHKIPIVFLNFQIDLSFVISR
jgi:hypothetical protein